MRTLYPFLIVVGIFLDTVSGHAQESPFISQKVFGPSDPGGRYKHPASITELANGDLYLAFYGGTSEYSDDTAVYGSRLKAGTQEWTPPVVIADTPLVSEGNTVVWQAPDGLVWLFYIVRYGETWSTSRIQAKISKDGAKTWSDPTILTFDQGMMVRGQPIVLKNGDYLLPIYHETGHDTEFVGPDSTSLFLRYDVRDRKWSQTERIRSKNGNIQPAVVALTDDHLVAYCRRGGGYGPETKGHIVRSESHDGGKTWSEGKDSAFPNPNAAVDFLKLRNGHLLLVYNHSMSERDPLSIALSTDNDKTYPYRLNVAEGETRDYAYPYIIQTKDDKIHLIFTSNRRTVINHVVFDENTILNAPQVFNNVKDPKAIEELRLGKRTVANAAWWGFDEEDSTNALQSAIESGAKKVYVPNMGKDWIVRPIQLKSNLELILEEGVVINAKRGEYRRPKDSVFQADGISNLTIRGYGSTIRMQKEDYIVGRVLKGEAEFNQWFGSYPQGDQRSTLVLNGCTNVKILGLTLRDSGGDGISINSIQDKPSKDIEIRNVVCDNHFRQGISITSIDGLLVENSTFQNTWGSSPSSGVKIEPESKGQTIINVVFRNCRLEDNQGNGIGISLDKLRKESGKVSILFENCSVTSRRGSGIRVEKVSDVGPEGMVEFLNCSVQNTEGYGIKISDKSALGTRTKFVNCKLRHVAKNRNFKDVWAPIIIDHSHPDITKSQGGIDLVNCRVDDSHDRPAIIGKSSMGLFDISGTLTVRNPHGTRTALDAIDGKTPLIVRADPVIKNVTVFRQSGRFGGWPANHGLWSWGNEILVGFSRGYHKDLGLMRHAIDRERPEEHLLARSKDGGETWTIEDPSEKGVLIPVGRALHGVIPPVLKEKSWTDCPGGIDFTHPDFAFTVRMTNIDGGPARFYYSTDRGKNWQGPFRLPAFEQRGIAARTDYLVNGRHDCTLFLTASKTNGKEGRPLCARTTDGGKSWSFLSWIGEEPKGYAIMPSTVRIAENEFLSAIRCREGEKSWIDTYRSLDSGKTWTFNGTTVPDTGEGNPPSMIQLKDGRVCLTYGYRAAPFGIRARFSKDGGKTWESEMILRDDGGGRDVGYPRSVQRPDGKIVTLYYYHDTLLGNRYIAATIWDPDAK